MAVMTWIKAENMRNTKYMMKREEKNEYTPSTVKQSQISTL